MSYDADQNRTEDGIEQNPFVKQAAHSHLSAVGSGENETSSEVNQILEKVNTTQSLIEDTQESYGNKLNAAASLQAALLRPIFEEALKANPNPDRSLTLSRAVQSLQGITRTLKEIREAEISDEVNPHSPKFQLVFSWFIDLIHDSMVSAGLDEVDINNVFELLAVRLSGWDDAVAKRLKGLSGRALFNAQSPFSKGVQERIRQNSETHEQIPLDDETPEAGEPQAAEVP